MSRRKVAIVLAAGRGTRMRSDLPKVLHRVAGHPMIYYPIASALALGVERIIVVLGHQRERVEAYLQRAFPNADLAVAHQAAQLGTGHAVLCAREALDDFEGDLIILSGDVPTLRQSTLEALQAATTGKALGVVSMILNDPARYGRMIRDESNHLARITEFVDCQTHERLINEVNAGIYQVDAQFCFKTLADSKSENAQKEYYLTELGSAAAGQGLGTATVTLQGAAAADVEGVNQRSELAAAEARMQSRLRAELMAKGVTCIDPSRVYLHHGVEVGADCIIEPDVSLLGRTRLGEGCMVEQGVRVIDSTIGDGTLLKAYSVIEDSRMGENCKIGPFARLRNATELADGVELGNFVETKKSKLASGVKAKHLAYLGDATVGRQSNIGAGTITCNYDGSRKARTVLGEEVFIGSDTQLVAPVELGDGAYVAAGSTVTEDVPADALAISRVPQKNIERWVSRRKARIEHHKKGS